MKETAWTLLLCVCFAPGVQGAEPNPVRAYSLRCAEHYATLYQVPIELVEAIIAVESNWQPQAVSPKGAVGLMQLMPATAVSMGVRNRFRIDENIRAGVEYLAWLMRLFGSDLRLVVAAYYAAVRPILSQRLEYSSPDVYRYVTRVARLYHANRARRGETEVRAR